MSLLWIASLLISLATGALLAALLLPIRKRGGGEIALTLFAGGGIGIGVSSCVHFLCLTAGVAAFAWAADLALFLLLSFLCIRRFRKELLGVPLSLLPKQPFSGFQILLASLLTVEIVASTASFLVAYLKEPHGKWDAWLIWNMHARFLFRAGEEWRAAFASGLDWSHWDYPLLLPLAIVRAWRYAGDENALVPAVMGFLFSALLVGLLLCSLSLLRSRAQGFLAAMLLLGTPFFITMGASQFADIPLAFFILATFVMIALQGRLPEGSSGPLVLAGVAAGLCAWTKNEGLLFLPIAVASLFGAALYSGGWRPAVKRTGHFLLGALPVLLIVLCFKLRLAPANDLVAGFGPAAAAAKLLDWGRYAEIARSFFFSGISFTQGLIDVRKGMHLNPGAVSILLPAVYLPLAGIRIDAKDRTALIQVGGILLAMTAGYFFVYVLTPLDLTYHLMTSLNRLFLQLWPGALFLFFMAAATPEGEPTMEEAKTTTADGTRLKTTKGRKRL